MSKSKEIAEQLKQFAPWYGGEVERLMQEAAAHILAQEAEIERLHRDTADLAMLADQYKAERDQALAEIERLKKQEIERLLRIEAKVDELVAERDQLQADLKAELDGNAALRQQHGAKDNETMFAFVARVVAERDQARNALRVCVEALQETVDWLELGDHESEMHTKACAAIQQAKEAL